jgi:hypothetical protein
MNERKLNQRIEGKKPEEELYGIVKQELANLSEIMDGGWPNFEYGNEREARSVIFNNLIILEEIIEKRCGIKSEKVRYSYDMISDQGKYKANLREVAFKIADLKDKILLADKAGEVFRKLAQEIIEAINSLQVQQGESLLKFIQYFYFLLLIHQVF